MFDSSSPLMGLFRPRRLFPVLLIAVALVTAQARYTDEGAAALVVGWVMALAAWLVIPLAWVLLFQDSSPPRPMALRLAAYVGLVSALVLLAGPGLAHALGTPDTFLTEPTSLFVCWALALVGGWGLGRDLALEHSLAKERTRVAALEREAERAQLLALRTHLDPHFLFNTLNAIAEWCREDGEVAEKAILQLAGMLRSMLEGVRRATWPLERELALVEGLLALHRMRDPERFRFQVTVAPGLAALEVPPLVLLPLVENAVKHGPAAGHAGEISLELSATATHLRLCLGNPGPYRGPRPGGEGLPTVRRRLALAYGDRATLVLEERDGRTQTRALLPLTPPAGGAV